MAEGSTGKSEAAVGRGVLDRTRAKKQHLLRLDEFQNPGKLLMRPHFEDTLKQLGLLRGAEKTQSVDWQLGVCRGVP